MSFFVFFVFFVVKKITTKDTKDTKNAAPIIEAELELLHLLQNRLRFTVISLYIKGTRPYGD